MKAIFNSGLTLVAAAVMLVSFTASAAEKKNRYGKQKVVYQINELDKAKGALRNVKNHLNALGDKNVEIKVVFHSKGAFALVEGTKDSKGNTFADQLAGLSNRGVKFLICANTIRGKKIPKDKINLKAEVIPSGVAEVAYLQAKGYLYVKP